MKAACSELVMVETDVLMSTSGMEPEDAGLLSKEKLLAGDVPVGLASGEGDDEVQEPAEDGTENWVP
jgi:hypothetical protein